MKVLRQATPQIEREFTALGTNEMEDDERGDQTRELARAALHRLEGLERLETRGDIDRMRLNLRRRADHRRRVADLDREVSDLRVLWAEARSAIQRHLGRVDPVEKMAGGTRAGGYS